VSAPEAKAFIALGGNVGDVRATFDRAVACLCDGAAVRLVARSSDYRTPPWGLTDQPDFVNAVILIATTLAPRALLARAQACEEAGPRPIDIDMLTYDDLSMADPDLTLPHPRLCERAFVLIPLAEIAPEQIISGVRVRDARERVDASGIEKLPPR
jgi:2-amino-4-hydroxy-6-hydroxymethyldihydropteridine diphosphokinase